MSHMLTHILGTPRKWEWGSSWDIMKSNQLLGHFSAQGSQDGSEIKHGPRPGLQARTPKPDILFADSLTSSDDSVWSAARLCRSGDKVIRSHSPIRMEHRYLWLVSWRSLSTCQDCSIPQKFKVKVSLESLLHIRPFFPRKNFLKSFFSYRTQLFIHHFLLKPLQRRSQKLASCPQNASLTLLTAPGPQWTRKSYFISAKVKDLRSWIVSARHRWTLLKMYLYVQTLPSIAMNLLHF